VCRPRPDHAQPTADKAPTSVTDTFVTDTCGLNSSIDLGSDVERLLMQVDSGADEVHARPVHVALVVHPTAISPTRLAFRRLLTQTRPANIQVPASTAGLRLKYLLRVFLGDAVRPLFVLSVCL